MTIDTIAEAFETLGDWEERYAYLIELGTRIPPLPEAVRLEENRVKGCMSQVWVHAYPDTHDTARIHFHGDCDTGIIKGVLALLLQMVDGCTAQEINDLDIDHFFERLHLYDHLSPSRHVGIYAIVEQMKKQARTLAE